jgi:hypothetical protein
MSKSMPSYALTSSSGSPDETQMRSVLQRGAGASDSDWPLARASLYALEVAVETKGTLRHAGTVCASALLLPATEATRAVESLPAAKAALVKRAASAKAKSSPSASRSAEAFVVPFTVMLVGKVVVPFAVTLVGKVVVVEVFAVELAVVELFAASVPTGAVVMGIDVDVVERALAFVGAAVVLVSESSHS